MVTQGRAHVITEVSEIAVECRSGIQKSEELLKFHQVPPEPPLNTAGAHKIKGRRSIRGNQWFWRPRGIRSPSLEAAELVMEEQEEDDASRAERVSAQKSPHTEQKDNNKGQHGGSGRRPGLLQTGGLHRQA